MLDTGEIDKAIYAHGMWKIRLKTAIDTGAFDTPVDTIRVDNQCAFGKWLYGETLDAADRASIDYQAVRKLHAEFHQAAARVAELALAGRKPEAEKLMGPDAEFASVSMKLTMAMMDWKQHVAG